MAEVEIWAALIQFAGDTEQVTVAAPTGVLQIINSCNDARGFIQNNLEIGAR